MTISINLRCFAWRFTPGSPPERDYCFPPNQWDDHKFHVCWDRTGIKDYGWSKDIWLVCDSSPYPHVANQNPETYKQRRFLCRNRERICVKKIENVNWVSKYDVFVWTFDIDADVEEVNWLNDFFRQVKVPITASYMGADYMEVLQIKIDNMSEWIDTLQKRIDAGDDKHESQAIQCRIYKYDLMQKLEEARKYNKRLNRKT